MHIIETTGATAKRIRRVQSRNRLTLSSVCGSESSVVQRGVCWLSAVQGNAVRCIAYDPWHNKAVVEFWSGQHFSEEHIRTTEQGSYKNNDT